MRARIATPVAGAGASARIPAARIFPGLPGEQVRTPQNQLAAALRHELRTPVATALMYMSIAERSSDAGNGEGAVRSALAVARKQIERIEVLVQRVTELDHLRRPALAPRHSDLVCVVGDIVRCTRKLEGTRASMLTMRGAPRRIIGWWDDDAIEQILHNLLSNALKFGDGKPIDVTVTPEADGAHIVVRDRGVGIPSEERERIFDRGVHAPADKAGGTGVGLWVVRLLAQAHGGGVMVSATPGGGSTFDVRLCPMPTSRGAALAAVQRCLGT